LKGEAPVRLEPKDGRLGGGNGWLPVVAKEGVLEDIAMDALKGFEPPPVI